MMRELGIRILRRSLPVVIVLGIMGYVFAEVFLMLHKMNGGMQDPANESVRWRTPLTMARLGVGMLALFECLVFVVRGKRTTATSSLQSAPDRPVAELHKPEATK